jgi:hypothetical protein
MRKSLTDPRADKKLPTKLKPVPGKSSCRLLDTSCFSDVDGEEDVSGHRDRRILFNLF